MTTQSEPMKVELIGKDISYIQKDIAEIKASVKELSGVFATSDSLKAIAIQTEERFTKLEKSSVTSEAFEPVKKIVYGLVSIILVAVVGGVIALVINR